MNFEKLKAVLILIVCLTSIEASRKPSYKHMMQHLLDQLAVCHGMFLCGYNRGYGAYCIPNTEVCDGFSQCEGGEDEYNCLPKTPKCNGYEILCPDTNKCALLCDGVPQCLSGIDESNCDKKKCEKGQVKCSDGNCAVAGDGNPECEDKSDENCPVCPTCKQCQNIEDCEVCEICSAGFISCISMMSGERECVDTCDDATDCKDEEDRTPLSTCQPTCFADGMRFQSSCYYVVTDRINPAPAQINCENIGTSGTGHLVTVDSLLENNFLIMKLLELFPGLSGELFWIDGRDDDEDDTFVDHTGADLVFTRFSPDQPDGGNCLAMDADLNYLMVDEDCEGTRMSICEIEDEV